VALVVVLLLAVTAVFAAVSRPGLAISMYALIPVVLGVYWFGLSGGLLVATTATMTFVGKELISPSPELSAGGLWIAALNRSLVFFGMTVLLWLLLRRTRALAEEVQAQQSQLAELESLRAVLIPTDIPERPHLEMATSFTPADGLVAGDFFLVVESPTESTPRSSWATSWGTASRPPGTRCWSGRRWPPSPTSPAARPSGTRPTRWTSSVRSAAARRSATTARLRPNGFSRHWSQR
jgi:hypothetical protein